MKNLIIFLLLISISVKAQKYTAEAPLNGVEKDGFYEIPLPTSVTALLFPDSRNIRIIDAQEAEVPYVVISERPQYNNVEWKKFRMEKDFENGCCTVITLFNDEKKSISSFLLEIRSAAIHKTGVLRGSDDGKTWYALRETFNISTGQLNNKTVIEVLDFPLSDYSQYRLTIDDSTSSPLNIVGAWLTEENVIHGMYVPVPNITFSQTDSSNGRYTWLTLHSDTAQFVHRLEFKIEGPRFYRRRAGIFENGHVFKDKKKIFRLDETQSFDLISGQSPVVYTYVKENDVYLRVDNENNPPLKFTDVRAYQLKQSLVAWLEAGRVYRIAIGSADSMKAPNYDLAFFKDSIPANPSKLTLGKLKEKSIIKAEEATPTIFKDKRIIWAAIALVIMVLGMMVMKMMRDKDLTGNQ